APSALYWRSPLREWRAEARPGHLVSKSPTVEIQEELERTTRAILLDSGKQTRFHPQKSGVPGGSHFCGVFPLLTVHSQPLVAPVVLKGHPGDGMKGGGSFHPHSCRIAEPPTSKNVAQDPAPARCNQNKQDR